MITYLKDLCHILEDERKGKTVVVAPGSFDLLHRNHLIFLENAKKQGDILVVAVKNDKCVHLKGKNRPIFGEQDRAAMVDGIKYVDYVIIVDYDPSIIPEVVYDNQSQKEWLIMFQEVFKMLKPDIFYHEINPVLEDVRTRAFEKYGIKGVSADRLKGISTSEIIEKIKNDK